MIKKYILITTLFLFIINDYKAIKVNFSTLQYSKSVLVGTEKLEINFADTLNFPNIDYNNIKEVA